MRKVLLATFLPTVALILSVSCKETQEIDAEYVAGKFEQYAARIEKVAYSIQRIDTFPQGKTVWNNNGTALIEKDDNDELFGFSFYGKRNDIPDEFIYNRGMQFEISKSTNSYQVSRGNYGFMGTPGGQMISPNIFYLYSIYKSRILIVAEETFVLKYKFEDDTVYDESDIIKTIELSKDNFFLVKITQTSKVLGAKRSMQFAVSNVKINEQVQNSIAEYKDQFKDYDLIQPETRKPNTLIGTKFPETSLPNLLKGSSVDLMIDKPTLVDFWETWFGPCIASLPKIEDLKNRYTSQIQVVGIVSEESEAAARLLDKKGCTFVNVIGNPGLLKDLNIDSWPTYLLIDKQGIVRKEYFGFSDQIERDIKMLLETTNHLVRISAS